MIDTKMRHKWVAGAGVAAMMFVGGCSELSGDDNDGFSAEEWKAVKDIQPLGGPDGVAPANPFDHQYNDVAVAKLGQMLFFETEHSEAIQVDGLSGKKGEVRKVGCVNCHDPAHYFIDSRPGAETSHGTTQGKRNSPTMVNVGWENWVGWTGRNDSLMMHGAGVMETSATRLALAHYMYKKYRDEYNAAFPTTPLDPALDPAAPDAARFPATGKPKANAMAPDGAWEKMTPEDQRIIFQFQANLGRIWEAYPRMLTSHGSPFEQYVAGDYAALTPEAKRGLRLFVGKAACNDCHSGPLLSDGGFHNIAVPMAPPATAPDVGRNVDLLASATQMNIFNGAGEFSDDRVAGQKKLATLPATSDMAAMEAMKGAFRTPMLLNIAETGPYFHTGAVHTLEEVVRHYNKGGGEPNSFAGTKDPKLKPLDLTDAEIADLVEFLKSLTGPLPAEWLQNTAKPPLPIPPPPMTMTMTP